MCIYKHVPHTQLENIKNEGFLLRRFYDRKRARLFATYMPAGVRRVSTRFDILKERKREEEREKK